jgi:hypothetical protein
LVIKQNDPLLKFETLISGFKYPQICLLEFANSIGFDFQEYIDFKTLFRYKKASTEKEEACQWDSVEALSKENPQRHSLNSMDIYQQNGHGSNDIPNPDKLAGKKRNSRFIGEPKRLCLKF